MTPKSIKIIGIEPVPGSYVLRLELNSGPTIVRDLQNFLEAAGGIIRPILDVEVFRTVTVDKDGALIWRGVSSDSSQDVVLEPNMLIWGSHAPEDPAAVPCLFAEVVDGGKLVRCMSMDVLEKKLVEGLTGVFEQGMSARAFANSRVSQELLAQMREGLKVANAHDFGVEAFLEMVKNADPSSSLLHLPGKKWLTELFELLDMRFKAN